MTQPTVDELARQIERLSGDEREELLNRILLMPAAVKTPPCPGSRSAASLG
jgi:hypothetical protein